ncbi:hypothetical protein EDD86DRAFT_227746 [Gorgonomyces haynaldii]|nr:hypothetical protein EDD86DRAFT_227746 [Gorgonomyces haynaldii]
MSHQRTASQSKQRPLATSPTRGINQLFAKKPATPQQTLQQALAPTAKLDLTPFTGELFDVEQYVNNMMQELPTEEVQPLASALADARDVTAQNLQKNVFRNYTEFVTIGKEITRLESDMLVFRGLLHDLTEINDAFRDAAGIDEQEHVTPQSADEIGDMKRRQKEEQLQEQRKQQLKILYQNLDGLQKLLPEAPGRYIVRDGSSSKYFEVNPSTYKDKDSAFIYVLTDTLVVAFWKKNMITGKNRLVADRVWPIAEIGFIDMKDSPDVSNAFQIIKNTETIIYRADTLEEKRSLLSVIQTITDEILAKKKKEKEKQKEKKEIKKEKQEVKEKKKKALKDNLSPGDYIWLIELPDELDVLIAHRDFEQTVTNVEKARYILAAAQGETPRVQVIRAALNERINHLAKLISLDLASPIATKDQVQGDIDKLLRLGLGDQARDIFLSARSKTIRNRMRHLVFDGDLVGYISEFAELTFRLIRNTCDWYGGSFHDTPMASGFMKWLQQEIKYFTETLRKQVFTSKQEFPVIAECLLTTLDHIQELRDVGLDLTFLMDTIIYQDIVNAIDVYSLECEQKIVEHGQKDPLASLPPDAQVFETKGMSFEVSVPKLGKSAYDFHTVLTTFGADVGILLSLQLYNKVVGSLLKFFKSYFDCMSNHLKQDKTHGQYCTALVNAIFVTEHMLPKTKMQLLDRFEREIPEMDEQQHTFHREIDVLRGVYYDNTLKCMFKVYEFAKTDYSSSASVLDNQSSSDGALQLGFMLDQILSEIDPILDQKLTLSKILDKYMEYMATDQCWETPKGQRKFGFGGVQTFVLDMHFLLRICDNYITESTNQLANELCAKAIKVYFLQNKDLGAPLKTGEWYDKRVDETVKKHKPKLINLLKRVN